MLCAHFVFARLARVIAADGSFENEEIKACGRLKSKETHKLNKEKCPEEVLPRLPARACKMST